MGREDAPPAASAQEAGPVAASRLTVLSSLRGYRAAWLKNDVSAGLAIAAVGLPSAIAYPAIAGLPPETGIYASIASVVGYALLGPSRRLIVGPDAATMAVLAGIMATALAHIPNLAPGDRVAAAGMIALGVGAICFLASLLRLGNLASLLSRPILAGFFIGVAISIILGQIGRVTGVTVEADGLLTSLAELVRKAGSIHWPSFLLALAMFAILQGARILRFAVPGPVIVVIVAVLLSWALGFEARGIRVVGDLPSGLPKIGLPWLAGMPWGTLIMGCAAVFVVSFGAGIITARSFGASTGERVDPNAELTGFGAANIASGLLGGFPVTSSDSRTAVNLSVGGRSQVAGLTAAVVLGVAVIYFSDLLRILPIPALGAILIAAALSVIDLDGLRQIWRISRVEFVFAMIAMAGAISFGVLQGVLVAIIATFVHIILQGMQPRIVLLGRLPGRVGFYKQHRSPLVKPVDGLTLCFIQGSLLFFNSDNAKTRLLEIIAEQRADTKWFVIDASAMTQIDSTVAAMLEEIRAELDRRGQQLGLAELNADVAALLARAGLLGTIGAAMLFDDLEDAVAAFAAARPQTRPDAAASADVGTIAGGG